MNVQAQWSKKTGTILRIDLDLMDMIIHYYPDGAIREEIVFPADSDTVVVEAEEILVLADKIELIHKTLAGLQYAEQMVEALEALGASA